MKIAFAMDVREKMTVSELEAAVRHEAIGRVQAVIEEGAHCAVRIEVSPSEA